MEIQKKKCSFKEHKDSNANVYCKKCEIYMCNKCEIYHSKLFENHKDFMLNKNIEEINNEFCDEETHQYFKLKYFCKNHNKLCCAACLTKIKGKGDGQHKDCNVCCIEDIKEEKKKQIKENIKLLKEISNNFNISFKKFNKMYENIDENKEKLKLKIQKIFTNIRNILNNREDELLLDVDKEYEQFFNKRNIIIDKVKLQDKINLTFEKCKNIENLDNNICHFISECKEIENNINIIKDINLNISKIIESKNSEIEFILDEKEINELYNNIKNLGKIKLINHDIHKLSSIIKDDIIILNLVQNWIEETINSKGIKFELIFKMSENGTKSSDFHKYCDNKGPTLSLIKTTKNKRFGGFTPLNWNNNGGFIKDINNQTFIFSLNLKKKYNMIKANGIGICCNIIEGPSFGNSDFYLKDNMKEGVTWADKDCNFFNNRNLELIGEQGIKGAFETEELEVYKVIY